MRPKSDYFTHTKKNLNESQVVLVALYVYSTLPLPRRKKELDCTSQRCSGGSILVENPILFLCTLKAQTISCVSFFRRTEGEVSFLFIYTSKLEHYSLSVSTINLALI